MDPFTCHQCHQPSANVSGVYCCNCNKLICPCCAAKKDHACHVTMNSATAAEEKLEDLRRQADTLRMRSATLLHLREEIRRFENSFDEGKASVTQTAHELIMKIREHETRLMDELEARREAEYRKLGISFDDLIQRSQELEATCEDLDEKLTKFNSNNTALLLEHDIWKTVANVKEKCNITNINVITNQYKIAKIVFSSVRCNTSFGTIQSDDLRIPDHGKRRDSHALLTISPSVPVNVTQGRVKNTSITHSQSYGGKLDLELLHVISMSEEQKQRRWSLQKGGYGDSSNTTKSGPMLQGPKTGFLENERVIDKIWEINQEGNEPGKINCPNDVTFLFDGSLVVSDRDNLRLQIFDTQGNLVKIIGQGKIKPRRIVTTKDGNIIVTDSKDNCVKVYALTGKCVSVWGKKLFKGLFKAPCGIATLSNGDVVVSDVEKHTVAIYQNDGKLLRQVGGDVSFQSPSYITTNSDDVIYISDNWNHCVQAFDKDGQYSLQISQFDTEETHFKYPNGVCCDEEGNLYAADWGNHTISHFDSDGNFVRHLLTRADSICYPAGIAIYKNTLAVCEYSDLHSSVKLYKIS